MPKFVEIGLDCEPFKVKLVYLLCGQWLIRTRAFRTPTAYRADS